MKKLSKLLLTLSFVLSITSSAFAVTVASWGGAYTESQKLGYGDPTAKKLGISIDWVDYSGGLSEIIANPISVNSNGDRTTVSLRPERALINTKNKMDNNFKGKIEEVIYHGDHTRVRLDLLGNKAFILKVPNSSANMDIKMGNEINVSWNSHDARALDPK